MPNQSFRTVSQTLLDRQPAHHLPQPLQRALVRRAQAGDAAAMDRLVEANLRLLARESARQAGPALPAADLMAAGAVGLRAGVLHFDLARGTSLITCLVPWIRQYIARERQRTAYLIYLPYHVQERLGRFYATLDALRDRDGAEPSLAELAAATGFAPDLARGALAASLGALSLDAPCLAGPTDHHPETFGELLPDEDTPPPEAGLETAELHAWLDRLLACIPDPLDELVVRAECGFDDGGEGCTHAHLGPILGVTRERVRQRHKAGLTRCRAIAATATFAPLAALAGVAQQLS